LSEAQAILTTTIGPKLNVTNIADWYTISSSSLSANGGAELLHQFGPTVGDVVRTLLPSHQWLPWKFSPAMREWWMDTTSQRLFLDWLRKELKYGKLEDFYGLRASTLDSAGGTTCKAS